MLGCVYISKSISLTRVKYSFVCKMWQTYNHSDNKTSFRNYELALTFYTNTPLYMYCQGNSTMKCWYIHTTGFASSNLISILQSCMYFHELNYVVIYVLWETVVGTMHLKLIRSSRVFISLPHLSTSP